MNIPSFTCRIPMARRNTLLAAMLFLLAHAGAQATYNFPVDIRMGLQNGQITVSHTPLDIGAIENAFDGIMGPNNVARSAGISPLVVTLQFAYTFNISATGIYTDNLESGVWSVESAGTLADLDNQTGSYLKLVDQAPYNTQVLASHPVAASGKFLRLSMYRLTGDPYVHLGEWSISATTGIQVTQLCMRPNALRLIPNAAFQPDWYVSDANGVEFKVSSGLNWSSGNPAIVSVDSSGVFVSSGNLGETTVTASWNGIALQKKVKVVGDFSSPPAEKQVVKVAMIIIDPPIPAAGGQRFSEVFWSYLGGPMALAQQTRDSMYSISGGAVDYQFVEIHDQSTLLTKFGGTLLTVDSMYKLFLEPNQTTLHYVAETLGQSEFLYNELLEKYDLCYKSNNHQIDEVWVWAMPFIGMSESGMTGTGAFWINGAVITGNPCTDLLPIMGFNYERYAGCALHNFSHRIETTMYRIFPGPVRYVASDPPYPAGVPKNPLQQFMAYEYTEPGEANIGNSHFPPNGTQSYDYGNPNTVLSYAPNWKRYPFLFEQTEPVNCSAWGCEGDCGLNFMSWWMRHMPHFKCKDKTGVLNNWWPYVIDYNEGKALEAQTDDCNCVMFSDQTTYCASNGAFPWHDWIAQVKMTNVDNSSGKSPYSDFSAQTVNVNAGFPVGITLKTGFSYSTYDEYWKVWIDYNQNGIFEEPAELFTSLVSPKPVDGTPFASVNTTAFIFGGFTQDFTTRMRVSMKRGAYPEPCEVFNFGEVEDYSIHIAPGGGQSRPDLSLLNFLAAGSGVQGSVVPYTFDLKNSGTANATGDYTIGAYLSTDSQLGPNDALVGVVQTGNTPIGTIPNVQGALAVLPNLAPGNYFLILKADVNNTIAELDELNNLISRPFTVVQGPGGADLELTLSADKTNVPIYNYVTYTYTVKNTGNQTITNAVIFTGVCPNTAGTSFSAASGLVYAGVPAAPTLGSYNFVEQRWMIANLAPGQSGTLSIKLFTLSGAERKVIAFCQSQTPGDPDSQPGAMLLNCTPTEDDEAVWTINAGQNANRESVGNVSGFELFPNPATGQVFFSMAPWLDKSATISVYNPLGMKVLEEKIDPVSPFPVSLDVSGLAPGWYVVKMETAGEELVYKKLVVGE